MTDPGSSMSLAGVIVMAVAAIAALGGWLGAVFFAAREPRRGNARPGAEDLRRASQPEASRHPGAPAAPARAPSGDGGTGGAFTHSDGGG